MKIISINPYEIIYTKKTGFSIEKSTRVVMPLNNNQLTVRLFGWFYSMSTFSRLFYVKPGFLFLYFECIFIIYCIVLIILHMCITAIILHTFLNISSVNENFPKIASEIGTDSFRYLDIITLSHKLLS